MKRNIIKAREDGREAAKKRTRLDLTMEDIYLLMDEAVTKEREKHGIEFKSKLPCTTDELYRVIADFYYAGLAIGLRNK